MKDQEWFQFSVEKDKVMVLSAKPQLVRCSESLASVGEGGRPEAGSSCGEEAGLRKISVK